MSDYEHCKKLKYDDENTVSVVEFYGFGRAYIPFQELTEAYSPEKGLERGTIFPELDIPYEHGTRVESKKNYAKSKISRQYEREFKNRDVLLFKISALDFTLLDIGLYLNINPFDEKALDIHRRISIELKRVKDVYENNYGPLTNKKEPLDTRDKWKWATDPWPWEFEANFKMEA